MVIIGILQIPRLRAYDECYMQNYEEWGSCDF